MVDASVKQRFWGNVQIAGPAHSVVINVGLIKKRLVFQCHEDPFVQVRLDIKQLCLPRAESDFQDVVVQRLNVGHGFHLQLLLNVNAVGRACAAIYVAHRQRSTCR